MITFSWCLLDWIRAELVWLLAFGYMYLVAVLQKMSISV